MFFLCYIVLLRFPKIPRIISCWYVGEFGRTANLTWQFVRNMNTNRDLDAIVPDSDAASEITIDSNSDIRLYFFRIYATVCSSYLFCCLRPVVRLIIMRDWRSPTAVSNEKGPGDPFILGQRLGSRHHWCSEIMKLHIHGLNTIKD